MTGNSWSVQLQLQLQVAFVGGSMGLIIYTYSVRAYSVGVYYTSICRCGISASFFDLEDMFDLEKMLPRIVHHGPVCT